MTVYVNALSPESVQVVVAAGQSGVDLSTVTAATFAVKKPDGSAASWSCVVTDKTASSATLTHPFGSGDVDQLGIYTLVPTLAVPAGSARCVAVQILVQDPYGA